MALELIETIEVGAGGAASITFSGIPQDGIHLVLKAEMRGTTGGNQALLGGRLNGDGAGNGLYDQAYYRITTGARNAAGNFGISNFTVGWCTASTSTAGYYSDAEITILNYTGSDPKNIQTYTQYMNDTQYAAYDWITATLSGRRNSTAAITALEIFDTYGGSIAQYSTFSLYKAY